jgi:hypothetical protein
MKYASPHSLQKRVRQTDYKRIVAIENTTSSTYSSITFFFPLRNINAKLKFLTGHGETNHGETNNRENNHGVS